MKEVYDADYVALHVRKTNRAALGLYRDTLGYTVHNIEKGYCEMQSDLSARNMHLMNSVQMPTGKMPTVCVSVWINRRLDRLQIRRHCNR